MTRKQLIKQLDRIVSGAHDADSDSPRRAEQGRQRLALARAERFFRSRIVSGLYAGRFFVTSERGPVAKDTRRYTVREALDSGKIETRGAFQAYRTLEDARAAARELAAATRVRSTRADDEAAHFRCEG